MKISTPISLIFASVFFQTGFAQSFQTPITNGLQVNKMEQENAKETFIKSQNYLSPSSLKEYTSYYGDSLKGFDEAKIKAELINHNVYGEEYLLYINTLKRTFINNRYKLHPISIATPLNSNYNQTNTNSKIIGGGNSVNFAPCVNEDFESSAVGQYTAANSITGWTVSSQVANSCATNTVWNAGSSKFWIVSTPITGVPSIGNLGASPLGGTKIAQLQNNIFPYSLRTKLATTFPVSLTNTLFQFAFAGVYNDGGHQCCEQPALQIKMYDCLGNPLSCSSLSLNAQGGGCPNGANSYTISGNTSWTNWQTKFIDLTPYIGTCVTIEIINTDCIFGGHYGMTFVDAQCGGQQVTTNGIVGLPTTATFSPVSYCSGSNLATIAAPSGYAFYQWYGPGMVPIAAPAGTQQVISISNPTPGVVYTADLTTGSGCVFTASNSITTSTVTISGLGSSPSCVGGASGSATVAGSGSGSGYIYSWVNASNSVVATTNIATGLAPGIYSISISGLGSAGCGTAVSTLTIGTAPQAVINLIKPFCGSNPAYLGTNGGSNFQWYGSNGAVTASLGGTAQNYTVTSPSSGSVVALTYLSSLGCQDSIRFILSATAPGFVNSSNISWACPGVSNGTAQISMAMAPGSPPGANTLNITSTGLTPSFNISFPASSSTMYPISGLSAGTYSIKAFDGSCYYTSNFAVNAFTFNFNVSPNSPTLCPGNCIAAGVTFNSPPSLAQYSYSWNPTTYLIGGIGNAQSTIICPTINVGSQSTIVYTIVVTPSVVNCPVSKTVSIHIINPAIPTFSIIPELCNSSAPYQIQTSVPGGTFITGYSGTYSPINLSTGLITPSHTNIVFGTNSFTYAVSENTCVAKSTATYEVSKFWTSALSSTVPPLCVTNAPFNLMNIVQNTVNGSWNGSGVTSNLLNPSSAFTPTTALNYSCFSTPNASACPSFTTLIVSITNTLTPTIIPVPEFCTNTSPFSMSVTPSGGNWFALAGVNNVGVVTPSNITSSTMSLNYSVTNGPCVNTATSLLYMSRFNSAALTATVPNLCYNSTPFNLMSIVQSTLNGSWNGPNGVISNSFITNGLATNIYVATYQTFSSPNTTLCPDSRTIAISNLNPPTPTIVPVTTLCNNAESFLLSVQPNSGHWINSSFLSSTGIFTPSLTAIGNNIVQYAIGTSTCFVQQSATIKVEAFVPATILSSINDLCNNSNPLNLSPLTLNNSGTWIGNGISGVYFDPQQSGAGNFTLKYTTASQPSGLCPDEAMTSVNVYSLAAPHITKLDVLCNTSLPIQLNVNPVGGIFGGANLGMVSLSGIFNPANAKTGANLITYSITSGPCVAHTQTSILIEEFVSADFAKQIDPFCKSANAVNLNSYVQHPNGTWAGPGVVGHMFNPSLADVGKTNFIVYTTYSYPSGKLCPDTSAVSIEVRDYPKVAADLTLTEGCAPLKVVFNCPTVNSGKGIWNLGDGKESYIGLDLEHTFNSPGSYTVVFNYEDEIGCKALPVYLEPIRVFENPVASFNIPEQALISDPVVQAVNITGDLENNKYEWRITNSSEIKTEVNPFFEFHKAGKYNIQLTSISVNECRSDITKTIIIKNNFNIYMPNAFSPNFDGLNDVFRPVFSEFGLDISSYSMRIIDRWGHQIFSTKDVQKGWNGSKGESSEILKEGVYNFEIRYKDLEGNSYLDRGHVSIVN